MNRQHSSVPTVAVNCGGPAVRLLALSGGAGSFCAALAYTYYVGRPEWLIRVGLLGIGLTVFLFATGRAVRIVITAALLVLASIVVFHDLGAGSLYDWDEAIYAEVAKEIAVTDSWMTLTLGGEPYFHKPPLSIWLTALAFRAGGIDEFTVRFWSACFGLAVVALTVLFGARLFSWSTGITASLLLLFVDHSYFSHWHNFISQARVGMLETALTFWTAVSLLLVWEARRWPKLTIVIGVAAGMAFMTKSWPGLFALLLPALIAGASGYLHRNLGYWLAAGFLAAAIILPWHAAQVWLHGATFVHDYVTVNFAGRLIGLVDQQARGPLFYLQVLHAGFGIFGVFGLLAYAWALWTLRAAESGQKLLLLIWITVPLLLFSLANTKLGWYVMVIYPAVALLSARAVVGLCGTRIAPAAVAVIMALFYFRLPIASDGNPEIKYLMNAVAEFVPATEPLYLYDRRRCDPGESVTQYHARAPQEVVPSIAFYLDRPLKCAAGESWPRTNETATYFVVDTRSDPLPPQLDTIVFEEGPFMLAALNRAGRVDQH